MSTHWLGRHHDTDRNSNEYCVPRPLVAGANGSSARTPATLISVRPLGVAGHDLRAPTCGGGQDPMVSNEVEPGRRDEGGGLLQQLQRLEDDVGRHVAPAVLELVHHPAIRQQRETLGRNRRTRHVPPQKFKPAAVPGRDADVCVEVVPPSSGLSMVRQPDIVLRPWRVPHRQIAGRAADIEGM